MKLFYSYSSADEAMRRELEAHLALLRREGLLETWSYRDINAGADWEREIDSRLIDADIILLLVSASFMASRYCWEVELQQAIHRADCGQVLLIPIIIRHCDWQTAPLARFQALPDGGKPVTSWRPRDRAWANVVAGIRRLLDVYKLRHLVIGAGEQLPEVAQRLMRSASKIHQEASLIGSLRDRLQRQRLEGRINLLTELPHLYQAVGELIRHLNDTSPRIKLYVAVEGERCTISSDLCRLYLAPSRTGRDLLIRSYQYGRHFGVGALLKMIWLGTGRNTWRETPQRSWQRWLTSNHEWRWSSEAAHPGVTTEELAVLLVKEASIHTTVAITDAD